MINKPKYKITKHAMQRYAERINFSQKKIYNAIIKDLKSTKNKRIINVGNGKRYIFFKNYREFVMQQKEDGTEVLITVIKHKRDKKENAIEKRLQEKKEYEEIMNDFIVENIEKDVEGKKD